MQIKADMITAMKAKESAKVTVLRGLMSDLKNAEIDLNAEGKELDQAESLKVLKKAAKKSGIKSKEPQE